MTYLNKATTSRQGPRERLGHHGAVALGDSELLAVLLGTGTTEMSALTLAESILNQEGGVAAIASANVPQLAGHRGVGPAKATRLVAAMELGRRALLEPQLRTRTIRTSRDVVSLLSPHLARAEVEHFVVLPLDARNRCMGEVLVGKGSTTFCPVDPPGVFRPLIRCGAVRGILVHNHPSGLCEPSDEDVELTERLVEAGDLLGLPVVDHIILAAEGHFSFAEAGLI